MTFFLYLCHMHYYQTIMRRTALSLILILFAGIVCGTTPKRKKTRRTAPARRTVKHVKKPVKLSIHDANPFRVCEDTCAHVHGIDVSHYQHDIFWHHIGDETNIAYAYLKCTEGADNVDPYYQRNIETAQNHKLKVGSYHFFRPKVELNSQLRNFNRQFMTCEQDLIPMLDVETLGGLPTQQFCDSLLKMLQLMEDTYHQKPLVYTYRNFYNENLQGRIDGYPLAIAMYADEQPQLADGRDFIMWQYTCKGRLPGVKGEVDKSRLVGNHRLEEIFIIR